MKAFFVVKVKLTSQHLGLNYCDCLQEIRPVPVYCNQWGVKHLVPEHLGRRQYVRDLVNLFQVVCTCHDDLRDIILKEMFSIRIMGFTQHIGYGGLTQQMSGPALKWFDPSLLLTA